VTQDRQLRNRPRISRQIKGLRLQVFELMVEGSAEPVTGRIDLFERTTKDNKPVRLTYTVLGDRRTLVLDLNPARGKPNLCEAIALLGDAAMLRRGAFPVGAVREPPLPQRHIEIVVHAVCRVFAPTTNRGFLPSPAGRGLE